MNRGKNDRRERRNCEICKILFSREIRILILEMVRGINEINQISCFWILDIREMYRLRNLLERKMNDVAFVAIFMITIEPKFESIFSIIH